jgi:hypothetical protein
MRYDELITDSTALLEAQLTPGQIKAIKVKIGEYEEQLRKLRYQKNELDDKFVYGNFPPELKDKVNAYVDKYTQAIKELEDQLKQNNKTDKFDNLMAGIKKNCSDIVNLYTKSREFFYSGFKNDQTVIYGKPPSHLNLGDHYENGEDVQNLLEHHYDNISFDNAILATSNAYNAGNNGRTPYIIFPRNGYKFFWPSQEAHFNASNSSIIQLMDYDTVKRGWEYFVNDPEMFKKFQLAGANIYDPQQEYIRYGNGFMGKYDYESQLKAIDKLASEGQLDADWEYMGRWTSWVTKESLDKYFNIQTDDIGRALSYSHDCIINTSAFYAINAKYKKYVFEALKLGHY